MAMSDAGKLHEFEVCDEVAALYEVSFILCGLFFCRACGAAPPTDTQAPACSDLHYYRVAESAYRQGWRPDPAGDCDALCPACIENQGPLGGRAQPVAPADGSAAR
jgi:hypothetical protein